MVNSAVTGEVPKTTNVGEAESDLADHKLKGVSNDSQMVIQSNEH